MAYSIGDVEALTGIKPHILRYWEEQCPLLSPAKDSAGHRLYSKRDLDTIRRLHFLINTRGFTVEGAFKELTKEMCSSPKTEIRSALVAVRKARAVLNDAYLSLKTRSTL